ncbi:hypothetical protein B296_00038994 [Ensete ventricosum]|uniref:Uncharacterized protein n=1 Tax=Ensete ventricosum TaxID=4639 RepID=A0A426Y8Z5_ENSVE|nr:hypothetical protein B296_00038994 [Ensete ventricosum]
MSSAVQVQGTFWAISLVRAAPELSAVSTGAAGALLLRAAKADISRRRRRTPLALLGEYVTREGEGREKNEGEEGERYLKPWSAPFALRIKNYRLSCLGIARVQLGSSQFLSTWQFADLTRVVDRCLTADSKQ